VIGMRRHFPLAPTLVRYVPRTCTWSLIVPSCPLCRCAHVHGGGNGAQPSLGTRVSHCLDVNATAQYELIEIEPGAWARLLGVVDLKRLQAVLTLPRAKIISRIDKKFRLHPGTAEAGLRAAALLAASERAGLSAKVG
jgi:hypothetical protein